LIIKWYRYPLLNHLSAHPPAIFAHGCQRVSNWSLTIPFSLRYRKVIFSIFW
jgi:hypothetical protein